MDLGSGDRFKILSLNNRGMSPSLIPDPIGKVYPMAYDLLDLGSVIGKRTATGL